MELKEKYLPIGSVVLLKEGTKKVMITGFCSIAEDEQDRIYDYSGCVYPEGYLDLNQICLFDHEQIKELYFIGYESDEESDFKNKLETIINDYKDGKIELQIDEDEETEDNEEIEDDEEQDLEYL